MAIINVQNLTRTFKSYKKQPGIIGSIKSLFKRDYTEYKAVDDISFSIKEGELIGFIGPNGAGKTTTLKCLSGLLYPSGGKVEVLGFTPFDRKPNFLKQISLVMGQKNQLWWDLPPMESFLLNKEIYNVPDDKFKQVVDELAELMEIKDLLNIQVRKLSLGQRMKCELVAQLIHSPKILFLDEPTIGLDVLMQQKLRHFVKNYNEKFKATIILTSHYMDDVKELCKRVIIIDQGKILFDGALNEIIEKFSQKKLLTIVFKDKVEDKLLEKYGKIKFNQEEKIGLLVDRENINNAVAEILKRFPVIDINIEDREIEEIIRKVFAGKLV